jgi:hypothetical protein
MTIQLDTHTAPTRNQVAAPRSHDDQPLFIGGWSAALDYHHPRPAEPITDETTIPDDFEGAGTEVNIFARQHGLRNKLSAFQARRRLNRTFRRNQREFDTVMNNAAHDPAGQRELHTSWTLGRR